MESNGEVVVMGGYGIVVIITTGELGIVIISEVITRAFVITINLGD